MADTTTAAIELTAEAPVAVFKKRGAKGKANLRKRTATPPPTNGSASDSDEFSSEDESGQRIKRRKKSHGSGAVVTSSKQTAGPPPSERDFSATVFQADRDSVRALDSTKRDATKQSNWFDQEDASFSAKSLLGSTRSIPNKNNPQGSAPGDTYKGLANQTSYIQRNPDAPNRKVGPVKAPTNIRTITITDMAPDVCKDYKQTGFCGFGDNCKFLHAREDYAHGWQLDKEWENVTKGKRNLGGTVIASADRKSKNPDQDEQDEEEEAILEKIPFACIICRGPYKSPVVTRCGHYFCENCALKRYRKDPGCAACGAGTNGVFNAAKRLQKLLDKKRERKAKRKQEVLQNGGEISSDEEEEASGEE